MLFVLGQCEYFGYSYSFFLGAVWEFITTMYSRSLLDFIFFCFFVCYDLVSNGTPHILQKGHIGRNILFGSNLLSSVETPAKYVKTLQSCLGKATHPQTHCLGNICS